MVRPCARCVPKLVAALLAFAAAPRPALAAPACPPGMLAVPGGALDRAGERLAVASFCLDRTEVTVESYATCVAAGACKAENLECGNAATWGKKGKGRHPVNCVDWFEADTFCREHGKRLPTEDEWEWAARGGRRGSTYPWGEGAPADRACWDGDGNEAGKGERKGTCLVASHPRGASALGFQDLGGNVREWTSSEQERFRVLRGGSWGDSLPAFLSASFRGWNAPDERMELLGFRCAAALHTVAHRPTRVRTARAATDEAGVMIFRAPIQLRSRARLAR